MLYFQLVKLPSSIASIDTRMIILNQGKLQQVLKKDFFELRNSLQFLDLSHNQISYIDQTALPTLLQLQVNNPKTKPFTINSSYFFNV